ncbi:hypothetical protein C8R43DRAFT_958977 [Mycena crocata]|nr:hypothetical protein C8R43DRAFT_958977 [Mycena crocata]
MKFSIVLSALLSAVTTVSGLAITDSNILISWVLSAVYGSEHTDLVWRLCARANGESVGTASEEAADVGAAADIGFSIERELSDCEVLIFQLGGPSSSYSSWLCNTAAANGALNLVALSMLWLAFSLRDCFGKPSNIMTNPAAPGKIALPLDGPSDGDSPTTKLICTNFTAGCSMSLPSFHTGPSGLLEASYWHRTPIDELALEMVDIARNPRLEPYHTSDKAEYCAEWETEGDDEHLAFASFDLPTTTDLLFFLLRGPVAGHINVIENPAYSQGPIEINVTAQYHSAKDLKRTKLMENNECMGDSAAGSGGSAGNLVHDLLTPSQLPHTFTNSHIVRDSQHRNFTIESTLSRVANPLHELATPSRAYQRVHEPALHHECCEYLHDPAYPFMLPPPTPAWVHTLAACKLRQDDSHGPDIIKD